MVAQRRYLMLLAPVVLAATAGGGQAAADEPELRPGQEVRVEAPHSGGYFVLYVPTDYTPKRRWPIIFCYHGQNGKPTTTPFRQVLQGRGFIIAGMEYLEQGGRRMTFDELDAYAQREVQSFRRVAAWVEKRLNVDKELYFCGGFSMGGWSTSMMGEAAPAGAWAGLAILGAGRQKRDYPAKNPRLFRGLPIYIGCGTKDPNFEAANIAVDFYKKHGARVTFEPYEGLAHEMKWDTKTLPEWLYANGPRRNLKARLAVAQQAEKANRLGRAYTLYHELELVSETSASCLAAAEAAKRLTDLAQGKLGEAEMAIAEKRYGEASRLLGAVAGRFEGSEFGERADALIKKLQSDPAIQKALRQARLDAQADELEARAVAAETARDYGKAVRLYEQYVAKFADAGRFAEVKARLDALRADKRIQAAILTEEAERECRVWLSLADNYLRANRPDKAREYLGKILTKYGETDWAARARERLATLDRQGN